MLIGTLQASCGDEKNELEIMLYEAVFLVSFTVLSTLEEFRLSKQNSN